MLNKRQRWGGGGGANMSRVSNTNTIDALPVVTVGLSFCGMLTFSIFEEPNWITRERKFHICCCCHIHDHTSQSTWSSKDKGGFVRLLHSAGLNPDDMCCAKICGKYVLPYCLSELTFIKLCMSTRGNIAFIRNTTMYNFYLTVFAVIHEQGEISWGHIEGFMRFRFI